MPNYNKVIFMGHLTRDHNPILVNETYIVNNAIAVNNHFTKKTMFIDFKAFNKLAQNLVKYTGKGSAVLIEGRLEQEEWEKEGKRHYKHVVIVSDVQFISNKSNSDDDDIQF